MIAHWTVGSLTKVFHDDEPGSGAEAAIHLVAARNEKEDAQICLRSSCPVGKVSVECLALSGPGGACIPADCIQASFVGYVPVHENTRDTEACQTIRRAPAFFPDPFIEWPETSMNADQTQPIWVTVAVPEDAPAGQYRGAITVYADDQRIEVPLQVEVWPFAIPLKPSAWHTEWFFPVYLEQWYNIERFSTEWWEWMERVARDMGQHRQNVILTPLRDLVRITSADNGWSYDYANLDRWIEIFDRYGVAERIEGGHLGGRSGDWESQFQFSGLTVYDTEGVATETGPAPVDDPARQALLADFLTNLKKHLIGKGWYSRFILHQADEPIPANEESYRTMSAFVRHVLPDVSRIDAMMSDALEGCVEIRVPQLQELKEGLPYPGEELWSYTCLAPRGPYPNRFLDFASLKTRIIHWLNWRYGATGYLHWGYAAWGPWKGLRGRVDPWNSVTGGSEKLPLGRLPLPPGDTHVVYPGQQGICSSIRWEIVRKGMEDLEYLLLVEEGIRRVGKDSEAGTRAVQLLAHIRDGLLKNHSEYTRSEEALLDARRQMAETIVALDVSG